MSWDVKSADMQYLATMAINECAPLTQKRKKETINKSFCGIMSFAVFLVSIIKLSLIYMKQVCSVQSRGGHGAVGPLLDQLAPC